MKAQALIVAVAAGVSAACGARAEPAAAQGRAVAAMYAEAARLAVSAEEAERFLMADAAHRPRPDVVAGIDRIVGVWGSVAAGASSAPAKVELRR